MPTAVNQEIKAPPSATRLRPYRIAHVAGTGRGATWMAEQLRELQTAGHQVCAIIPEEGSLSGILKSFAVPYELRQLDACWSLAQIKQAFVSIYGLAWHIFRERYDIVHAHLFPTIVISRIAAWIADAPVRISMIPGPLYMQSAAPPLLEQATCWMDTRIIGSCQLTNELYGKIGVPGEELELVYYGPDESKFCPASVNRTLARKTLLDELGLEEKNKLIGLVAFFYPRLYQSDCIPQYLWGKGVKGHEMVVGAVKEVVAQHPEARFLFVGEGWGADGELYLEEVRQLVNDVGLSEFVRFVGHRKDVPEILAALDVALQCSLNENLGGTVEALLMEKPTVATRVGGMPDSVIHERTGLLVEMDDSAGLAAAIVRLLDQPAWAEHLGKNGRALMLEKFCLSAAVNDLQGIYETCMSQARSEGAAVIGYRWYVVAFRALIAWRWILCLPWFLCRQEMNAIVKRKRDRILHRLLGASHPEFLLDNQPSTLSEFLIATIRFFTLGLLLAACKNAYIFSKRAVDIFVAAIVLALSMPLLLIPVLSRKLAGDTLFDRKRAVGSFNREFNLVTFARSPGGCACNSLLLAKTWWLPLFWNVLVGDMSLIGTRVRATDDESAELSSDLCARWPMRPGIIGWCQCVCKATDNGAQLDGYDYLYMAHASFWLDAKIFAKTVLRRGSA